MYQDFCFYEYSTNTALSFYHISQTFCGIPIFVVCLAANIAILLTALLDPLITVGTLCSIWMPVSKVILSLYIDLVKEYSKAMKLKGRKDSDSKIRGLCNCCCCWIPAIVSGLIMLTIFPIGFVADIFLTIFSGCKFKLSLTYVNLQMIRTHCTIYAFLVRGYG
jgi:hypothetical protein